MLVCSIAMRPRVIHRGMGILLAGAADVSGIGAGGPTGTLIASAATIAGVGVSSSTGTGALAAQAATVDGAVLSSWTQIDSWTHSVDVATVDFTTGLSGYSEFMVVLRNTTLSVSGSRIVQVSSDGGSTWKTASGDYRLISTAGVESDASFVTTHTTNATAARTAIVHLVAADQATGAKVFDSMNRTGPRSTFYPTADTIDGIRCATTAGNYTGGTIRLYAR